MSAAIEFKKVVNEFGPVRVLHGVSFALPAGRVQGLLGENGAAKSTLMKMLAGYESVTSGELLVDGQPRRFAGSYAAEALGTGHCADSPGIQPRRRSDGGAKHFSGV